MGNLRAWLGASTLGLVFALPHVTLAGDAGPGKEVRAIRHELPALLAGRLSPPHVNLAGLVIDSVVVQPHGIASAEWHTRDEHRVEQFVRLDGWWMLRTPADDAARIKALAFSTQQQLLDDLGGYQIAVRFSANDANTAAQLANVFGRAPTEAESSLTPGGNSFFFFSGTVNAAAPIHVQAGTTIDVWFPFVLDPALYYAITIAHADKPIGPIDGVLKDNIAHFVLPAFTLAPGATLMGEIEGDSFRHE